MKKANLTTCFGAGCKNPPAFRCQRLWADRGLFVCCAQHRPGIKAGPNDPAPGTWYAICPLSQPEA